MQRDALKKLHSTARILAVFAIISLFPTNGSFAQEATDTVDYNIPGITVDSGTVSSLQGLITQDAQRSQYGTYEHAIVKQAVEQTVQTDKGASYRFAYELEITSGKMSGQIHRIAVDPKDMPAGFKPKTGDAVIVYAQITSDNAGPTIFFESFDRQNIFIWVVLLLIAGSVLLAGWRGLKLVFISAISLLIYKTIALPMFVLSANSLLTVLLSIAILSFFVAWLTVGWNRRMSVVIAGTLLGSLCSYIVLDIFASWAHFGSLFGQTELFREAPLLDPKSLLLIGAMLILGSAIINLAIAIANGVNEMHQFSSAMDFKDLFSSGMIIGREKLYSLAPIIIFAFLAAAMLYLADGTWANLPLIKTINNDAIAQAVILPLVGLLSLLVSVPAISFSAALAWTRLFNKSDPMRRAISWREDGSQ